MNSHTASIGFVRFLVVLFACSGFAAHGQQAVPIPPPKGDRAPAESRRENDHSAPSEKEVQEYRDLARQLGQEIDKLIRKGLRDAADEVQRRLDRAGVDPQAKGIVDHLLEAAEHLSQAGMQEEAMKLRRQAEELAQKSFSRPPLDPLEMLQNRVDQLEKAVQGLKEENRELRRLIPQKPL